MIAVMGRRSHDPIEVATFRSDGAYIDGRRPEGVIYTTAEEDAQRYAEDPDHHAIPPEVVGAAEPFAVLDFAID